MRWFLVVSVAIVGCASAGQGNSILGGLDGDAGVSGRGTDANDFTVDAAVFDAPPDQVTLNQAASSTITDHNSFACSDIKTNFTSQNSYYRLFTLSDFGVTTTLHLTRVDFAIQAADAGPDATQQPAQIILGTYGIAPTGDTLDPTQISPLGDPIDLMIADGTGVRMSVPVAVDVAAGSRLLVQLSVPDGVANSSTFFIGSNAQGERQPGYMSSTATDCGFTAPTTVASIATSASLGEADIIISATGTR